MRQPVYAVYDWFVKNRPIDWPFLFERGLGEIKHACLIDYEYPNAEVSETTRLQEGLLRKDVQWTTDIGELNEWYLGEWRQEYLIKTAQDYLILARALEGTRLSPTDAHFDQAEAEVGERGITVGQIGHSALENRTPLQSIQIDCAGLERFSIDLALEVPELMELIELMNQRTLEKFRCLLASKAGQIKLWENLSIETMGPSIYRRFLVPLYGEVFGILEGTGKKLQVHYDGKLRPIAEDIRGLPFDGIDSLTGPPEGDLSPGEARGLWPDKFFWLHPNLGWYRLPEQELRANILRMVREAAPGRCCLMISEEVPADWRRTVPVVLDTLEGLEKERR